MTAHTYYRLKTFRWEPPHSVPTPKKKKINLEATKTPTYRVRQLASLLCVHYVIYLTAARGTTYTLEGQGGRWEGVWVGVSEGC